MDSGFPFGVPSRLEYTSGRLRFSPGYRRPPRTHQFRPSGAEARIGTQMAGKR
jgi:hypothetical protein